MNACISNKYKSLTSIPTCSVVKDNKKMETFNIDETLAIDFGTINSTIAYWKYQGPQLIMENTTVLLPSCCEISKNAIRSGTQAQKHIGKENVIYGIKRIVGRRFSDPVTQSYIAKWPFAVIKDEDEDKPVVSVPIAGDDDFIITPGDAIAQIVSSFKTIAERNTNRTFKNVIVTVPAFFDILQKEAIVEAFQSVFDRVVDTVLEPTAAAFAYCVQDKIQDGKVFVFDLGGGTFDITILQIQNTQYRVLGTGGNENLGGMDFTQILMDMIVEEVKSQYGIDVSKSSELFTVAENLKKQISYPFVQEGSISLNDLDDSLDNEICILRDDFNQRCLHLFEQCRSAIMGSLQQANLAPQDIDYVVLIGGSSRILYIESILKSIFGNKIMKNIYPEEAVVKGAMLFAAYKAGIPILNTPYDSVLPETDLPPSKSVSLPVTDLHSSMPALPPELVSDPVFVFPPETDLHPSIRVSPPVTELNSSMPPLPPQPISHSPTQPISPPPTQPVSPPPTQPISSSPIPTVVPDLVFLDSLRKSFVMEQPGDTVYTLLKKGTSIPYKGRQILLQTVNDYDSFITIAVAEGDSPCFSENSLYARLFISDIPCKKRGEVKVVLTIDVNSAGMVSISASTTGANQQKATVELIKPY